MNASIAKMRVTSKQRPLVLAHGCFDLLHLGHIRHLHEARKLGNWLVVSVTSDRFVNKGAGRPRFTSEERAEALRALGIVDEVMINDAPNATPMIAKVRPDFYVKGADYISPLPDEAEALAAYGGKFTTTKTKKWSSSRLLNEQVCSDEVTTYLRRAREFLPKIEDAFERVKTMRVVFVGESIVDQYVYVAPLAKPSKEFVSAAAIENIENFLGGVHAAAAHVMDLCNAEVVAQPAVAELVKRRYVERGLTRKVFETYSATHITLDHQARTSFELDLALAIERADAVVVFDFGHGLITQSTQEKLAHAKFLAVNAQTNAGNQGFNPVTKYGGADFVCVDAPEARLAAQDQFGDLPGIIEKLSLKMGNAQIVVTHGRKGSYWSGGHVPALASKPIDTMGAGDCFLAFTAPLIAAGLEVEAAAFVGNVAGGMKTEIVGHRQPVNPQALLQTVRSLLQ